MSTEKAFLIILDGWGIANDSSRSAIDQAKKPYFDSLINDYPHSELVTYGEQVGLPEGQMGNSEVGHLNIGAGRVVYQDLAKINKAVREDTLKTNQTLVDAIAYANKNNVNIHLMGLLSDGGVHSHINHLKALCDIVNDNAETTSYIHAFLDGRDTDPQGGKGYLKEILDYTKGSKCQLSTVVGRYYAMDRDTRWERIQKAYDLLITGKGESTDDILASVQAEYDQEITDEFMPALNIATTDGDGLIKENDVVLFFNYRTDRPRQITEVLTQSAKPDHGMNPLDLYFVTMTNYDSNFKGMHVMYNKDNLKQTIGEVVSNAGRTQLRIAETEKYPHVTFFFSGGQEKEFDGESRLLVSSPKVATYDLQPEMSASEITDKVIQDINEDAKDFICLNFANTDMVGHTGMMDAAIKATEAVDGCLSKIVPVALKHNYSIIIIADHGNSDIIKNEDGSPHTAHTLNPVPCIIVSNDQKYKQIKDGALCDIAPSLLDILSVAQPEEMTGQSLIS